MKYDMMNTELDIKAPLTRPQVIKPKWSDPMTYQEIILSTGVRSLTIPFEMDWDHMMGDDEEPPEVIPRSADDLIRMRPWTGARLETGLS
ncbi:hypothetical protein NDU88_003206 [Pleurodeles waltl]|uniref:Uncharacterized protein n=1 Tax=Pleurodeles waltl TaxID=8319 RepID=A0AAV7MR41_PLEWA|nr:hypothetical protein NDU88_003206 [Pleurodeles waltl]